MRVLFVGLTVLLLAQPACIWKLWSKGEPEEERIYDVYGTVESVTRDRLVIRNKKGPRHFVFRSTSIKGSDFDTGTYVHVYFKKKDGINEITMVVEKIG